MVARGASAIGGRRVTRLWRRGGEPGRAGEAYVLLLLPMWLLPLLEMVLFVKVFVRILVLVVRSFGVAVRLVVIGVRFEALFMTLRVRVGTVAVLFVRSFGADPVRDKVPLFVLQNLQMLAVSRTEFGMDPTLFVLFPQFPAGHVPSRHILCNLWSSCVARVSAPRI